MDERVVNQTVVACRAILNVSLTQSVPQDAWETGGQIQTSQRYLHRRPLFDTCCNDTDIGIPVVVPLHSSLNISTLQKQIYKPCPIQRVPDPSVAVSLRMTTKMTMTITTTSRRTNMTSSEADRTIPVLLDWPDGSLSDVGCLNK